MIARHPPTIRRQLITSVAALCASTTGAYADRYEATIIVRPSGQLARLADSNSTDHAVVAGGGLATGFSWGVRNWLDVGGELSASTYAEASHDPATVAVLGNSRTGALTRTTRLAHLRGVATLRLGVAWVPTIQLALGGGARYRTAASLRFETPGGATILEPDGEGAELVMDLAAGLRLGLERRLTPNWTAGISAGASYCVGVGAPDLQFVDAAISVSYVWYAFL